MTYLIFEKAKSLLGDADANEVVLMEAAQAANAELSARLKDGISPEEIRELFISAAGVLTLSAYSQLGDASDISSFKAGDISVSRRGAGAVRSSAQALRQQAENMLFGYIEDRSFGFRAVRG